MSPIPKDYAKLSPFDRWFIRGVLSVLLGYVTIDKASSGRSESRPVESPGMERRIGALEVQSAHTEEKVSAVQAQVADLKTSVSELKNSQDQILLAVRK